MHQKADSMQMELRLKQVTANSIDAEQIKKELKNESDYRAYYVTRIGEEIVKENAKKSTAGI